MKKILSNTRQEYDLFEEQAGTLILSLLCGSIGLYEVRIRLSDAEVVSFRDEGESYLDRLVTQVRQNETAFSDRFI